MSSSVWTPRFTWLFALIAVLGCALVIFGISGIRASAPVPIDLSSATLAAFSESIGVAVTCLLGLWLTRNQLLRAGLLLLWGAAAAAIVTALIILQPITVANSPSVAATVASLGLLSSVLNLGGMICLSYGMVRWRQEDRWFLLLQLLLTVGLGWALVQPLGPPSVGHEPLTAVCGLAAVMAVLARPACWQVRPFTTFGLTLGRLVGLLYFSFFFRQSSLALVLRFQLLNGVDLSSSVLFLLGLLLLIRTEHLSSRDGN